MLCGLVGRWISHSLFVVMGVRVVIAAITMGFQSEGSPSPNTFHGNPHISVITSSMNVSRCCLYKEGRLLLYKSANKNTCSVVTEKISFEDKPMISCYSNRQKELIFAAVYFQGGCSNPSVTIRDDRSSVFLSKSNHSSVESFIIHEELLRKEGPCFQL